MNFIKNLLLFSRFHTILGTTLSIIALYLIALSFTQFQSFYLTELWMTLIACLCANIYIVGLNQITDIEIDKINKPWLPLASGAISLNQAYWFILICLTFSLLIAIHYGEYLLWTVILSLLLGTLYSLPPFRLKRFYFWAAFCIIAVRGIIVNLLLFLHFHSTINSSHSIPLVIWLLAGVIFFYSIMIAWYKDIPDMEGDDRFHIKTMPLRIGARNIVVIGSIMITVIFLILIIAPFSIDIEANAVILSSSHLLMLLSYWFRFYRLNLFSKTSVPAFYQFIWLLFFTEYVVFTAAAIFV